MRPEKLNISEKREKKEYVPKVLTKEELELKEEKRRKVAYSDYEVKISQATTRVLEIAAKQIYSPNSLMDYKREDLVELLLGEHTKKTISDEKTKIYWVDKMLITLAQAFAIDAEIRRAEYRETIFKKEKNG